MSDCLSELQNASDSSFDYRLVIDKVERSDLMPDQYVTEAGRRTSCLCDVCLQTMEASALGDWLLGARPANSCPAGYQSSNNLDNWLLSQQESQVREASLIGHFSVTS